MSQYVMSQYVMSHKEMSQQSGYSYKFVMIQSTRVNRSKVCARHTHLNESHAAWQHGWTFSTMQHTATHTASHCNTLQHTATHRNARTSECICSDNWKFCTTLLHYADYAHTRTRKRAISLSHTHMHAHTHTHTTVQMRVKSHIWVTHMNVSSPFKDKIFYSHTHFRSVSLSHTHFPNPVIYSQCSRHT